MQEGSGLPSSAAKTGSQAVDTRQEQRLHIAVPVKVFPDIRSAEWQTCCTYEISMIGARLASMAAINKVGQVIWIQRLNRRAKYKVIWIGQSGTSQAGQVGV